MNLKRILSIAISALLCLALLPTAVAAVPANGEGTLENPYTISSIDELKAFRDDVNSGNTYEGKYVLLTADIDLSTSGEASWTPIAARNVTTFVISTFNGTFDGGNHQITGLYIDTTSNRTATYQAFIGQLGSSGTVQNLKVSGTVNAASQLVAGVVANNKGGRVINCHSTVSVTGTMQVGGVVGKSTGTVSNCSYSQGTVSGSYSGGIVCYSENGDILHCFNSGSITGSSCVGGITGSNGFSVDSCYNIGEVNGTSYTGGLVGFNFNSIKNSYNAGKVNGGEGSLVGVNNNNAEALNSYYLCSTTPAEGSAGTAMSQESFASGEVAYLLNNGVTDGTQAFYQTCGVGLPAFSGMTVYKIYNYSCPGDTVGVPSYSNTSTNITGDHIVTAGYLYDDAGHWNACSTCDDKLNYEAHTLDFVIERYPTEAVSGSGHYECSVCGYVSASVPTYSAQPIPETVVTPPQPSEEDTSDVTLDEDNVPGSDVTIDEPVQSGQSDEETDGSEDSEQESAAPNPQTGLIAPMGLILAAAMAALVGKRG